MRKTKLAVTSLLIVTLFLGTAISSFAAPKQKHGHPFSDVDQAAWALPDVAKMKAICVIKGYEDGTFRPNASIDRQDAVLMTVRLVGLEEEAEKVTDIELPFDDADKIADYAKGAVALAYQEGWLDPLFSGHKKMKFQPNKSASRLWVTVMLVNALADTGTESAPEYEPLDFEDSDEVQEGLACYIVKAVELGLIKGFEDGTLQPNKAITRAQMAALLSRTDDNMTLFECKKKGYKGHDEIEGTVVSTADNSITIQTEELETVTVTFTADISIFIEQTLATWEDIEPGDEVEVKINKNGLAVFIKAEREDDDEDDLEDLEYKGTVTAIILPSGEDEGSIEIQTHEEIVEFILTSDVELEDNLEFSDIEAGMTVEIEVVDDTVVKIEIEDLDSHEEVEDKQDKNEENKDKHSKKEKQRGKVAGVALPGEDTEGTITIYLGNSGNTRTFKLGSEVEIDGADSLEEISEGVMVELKLSDGYVIEIEVED